jgi:acyl-CoA thioesterase I
MTRSPMIGVRMNYVRLLAAVLALALLTTGSAWATEPVPVPDGFAFLAGPLKAVRAAVQHKSLSIVAIVGPVVNAEATRDPTLPYPNRLAVRLREAWPGVTIRMELLPIARADQQVFDTRLRAALAQYKPALVLWGPGGSAAARGDDLASFNWLLSSTIQTIAAAGSDVIMMTPLYAPALAHLFNLQPYRLAVVQAGEEASVSVLDRYELLRYWSDNGILDFDSTNPAEQLTVARSVNDWTAELLASGIIRAAQP